MTKHKQISKLPFVVIVGSCSRNSSAVWMHAIDSGLKGNCHVFITEDAPKTLSRKRLHRISTDSYNNNIIDAVTLGHTYGDIVAAYVLPEHGDHTLNEINALRECRVPMLFME